MNLYIVTGTTRGLGQALAERIAADGGNELITLARGPDAAVPGGARFECDMADARAVERAFDRIEQRVRGKRYEKAVLINNAGIVGPVGPLEACDGAALERNIAVNVVAPMLLMRRFLAALEGSTPLLRIINISSGAGRRAIYGWSAYCTAKAALDMATRVVAVEAQARNRPVEAVSLAPGVIDTGMQGEIRATTQEQFMDVERFRAMQAEGKLRPPAEVAADILRLEAAGKLVGDAVLDLRELG
jgi:benzil reductase ((S)-benzoin forming)